MTMGSTCQASKHACGEYNTYSQHRQAQAGIGLYIRLQKRKDDDEDQHVQVTACEHYKQSYEMSYMLSGSLKSTMHAIQEFQTM